jgi:hypothetical protein
VHCATKHLIAKSVGNRECQTFEVVIPHHAISSGPHGMCCPSRGLCVASTCPVAPGTCVNVVRGLDGRDSTSRSARQRVAAPACQRVLRPTRARTGRTWPPGWCDR